MQSPVLVSVSRQPWLVNREPAAPTVLPPDAVPPTAASSQAADPPTVNVRDWARDFLNHLEPVRNALAAVSADLISRGSVKGDTETKLFNDLDRAVQQLQKARLEGGADDVIIRKLAGVYRSYYPYAAEIHRLITDRDFRNEADVWSSYLAWRRANDHFIENCFQMCKAHRNIDVFQEVIRNTTDTRTLYL